VSRAGRRRKWAKQSSGLTRSAAGRRLPSTADLAPFIANLWSFNVALSRYDRAAENAAALFHIASERNDADVLLQAHHVEQGNRAFRGEFVAADRHISAALALYDRARHAHHRYLYLGHDPGVCMLAIGAVMQSALGHLRGAVRREQEALALARDLRHPPSLAHALWFVCESQSARGDTAAVATAATELLALSESQGLGLNRAFAVIFLGWARACSGETTDGIARLSEGLAALGGMGARMHLTRSFCLMAESLLRAARYAEGLAYVERGLEIAAETGEGWYLARLYQVRGELMLHLPIRDTGGAERSLRQAITVARQQQARLWQLRAATSLARLWGEQGRRAEARELLAPVCRWFTEGFDTTDLRQAKALLDGLA
jgi:predicted ATPase